MLSEVSFDKSISAQTLAIILVTFSSPTLVTFDQLGIAKLASAMEAIPCLNLPSTMKMPTGHMMHRQWAVLERSSYDAHENGNATQVMYWADFPPILNDLMNAEVTKLAEQLSGVAARHEPIEEATVKYLWPSFEWSNTGTWEPIQVECVIDLVQMTQWNTKTGMVRQVRFSYKL